jgi:23S rRNA-intervening sequence protein
MTGEPNEPGGVGAQPPPAPNHDHGPMRRTQQGRERQAAARSGGPALEAMYQFLLWLIPTLEKFPRSQKFQLGDRLQTESLAVLDKLIEATYTRERLALLRAANMSLEKLRFGVRLAKDLRHLDLKRYEHAARAIDEVGRLVGGWVKADRSGTPVGPGAPRGAAA